MTKNSQNVSTVCLVCQRLHELLEQPNCEHCLILDQVH